MTFEYDPETGPVIKGPISHAAARLEAALAADAFRPRLEAASQSKAGYAGLIKPVAEGLFALAVAGGKEVVQDLTATKSLLPEATGANCGDRFKLFAANAFSLSVSNPWAAPGNVWGPGGAFNLAAVLLEWGYNIHGPLAELTLVLPVWTTSPILDKPHEFALIKFDTSGYTREERVRGVVNGGGFTAPVERYQALKYMLGIESVDGFQHHFSGSSGISSCLGFPFAEEALLSKMPLLKDYLIACAVAIGNQND